MATPILNCKYPARGGQLTDGSFEALAIETSEVEDQWYKVLGAGGSAVWRKADYANPYDGTYVLWMQTGSAAEHCECHQKVSDFANLQGDRVTFCGRVVTSYIGVYLFIETAAGVRFTGAQATGAGDWEVIRVMADIPDDASYVKVGIVNDAQKKNYPVYLDSMALIRGDSYPQVVLSEGHVFPVGVEEGMLVSEGMTVGGDPYYSEEGVTIPFKGLRLEAISETLFQKLRNFFRYVTVGPTYETEYTDVDGQVFTVRLMRDSFGSAQETGPGLFNCAMTLRIKDKGL